MYAWWLTAVTFGVDEKTKSEQNDRPLRDLHEDTAFWSGSPQQTLEGKRHGRTHNKDEPTRIAINFEQLLSFEETVISIQQRNSGLRYDLKWKFDLNSRSPFNNLRYIPDNAQIIVASIPVAWMNRPHRTTMTVHKRLMLQRAQPMDSNLLLWFRAVRRVIYLTHYIIGAALKKRKIQFTF